MKNIKYHIGGTRRMYDSKEELLESLEFGYLSEFPQLKNHFERFRGRDTARYTREEIWEMMSGLEPKGDDMIRALYETGMLEAQQGRGSADSSFEIPKLFRVGLGLVLRGRP